jgi:hypothetical protein
MIGFLKSRSLKQAAARAAAATGDAAAPSAEGIAGDPGDQLAKGTTVIETALARESAPPPERYQIRENTNGWSVEDNQTGGTAEIHGFRLARMNRSRAESLVAVLNRTEARKAGRNG